MDNIFLYVGIIDDYGVDTLSPATDIKEFGSNLSRLSLRCRFNSHRNPKIFSVRIPSNLYDSFSKHQIDSVAAAKYFAELESFNVLYQ